MCSPRFTLESLGDLKNTDVWVPRLETLVTQIVKGLPAMRETWVGSLSWEDPLEEGMATHSRPSLVFADCIELLHLQLQRI